MESSSEDSRQFLRQEEGRRKDSNFTNFARKMSTIVMGEPGTLRSEYTCTVHKTGLFLFRHRRRSRRSTRNGSGGTSKSRSKSLSPLQNGQKLQFDVSKGGIFLVKRKKTFCETIMSSGWLKMQLDMIP